MKLCINTDSLGYLSFEEMVRVSAELGIESLEIACGNWSEAPHIDLDKMLSDEDARKRYMDVIRDHGMTLEAFNCSGNQLDPNERGKAHQAVVEKTFRLAELLEVKHVVMMSGLPGGSPWDRTANWITTCWPPCCHDILKYQWEEVLIPYWERTVRMAGEHGVESIALENHGYQCVYNAETLLRLRDAVGSVVGMNLDPSHHMWMGGDAVEMASALGGEAIHHVHAKDLRKERFKFAAQGGLETKSTERMSERSWNYVAMGYGMGELWWREFFSVLRMLGYDGPISLEIEDKLMPAMTAVRKSVQFLQNVMPRDFC